MRAVRRFPPAVVSAIERAQVIGLRAGDGGHRFIAVWAVVVEGRVFVRSWTLKPDGWTSAFAAEPVGAILVGSRRLRVRAVRTRSARLKDAVSRAYREKYRTPGAVTYVAGFARGRRKDSTTELLPRS